MIHSREQPEWTRHWPPKHRAECWEPFAVPGINSPESGLWCSPEAGDPRKRLSSGRTVTHISCYLTTNSVLQLARPVWTSACQQVVFLESSHDQLHPHWLLSGTCCPRTSHSGPPALLCCGGSLSPRFHAFLLGLPPALVNTIPSFALCCSIQGMMLNTFNHQLFKNFNPLISCYKVT